MQAHHRNRDTQIFVTISNGSTKQIFLWRCFPSHSASELITASPLKSMGFQRGLEPPTQLA